MIACSLPGLKNHCDICAPHRGVGGNVIYCEEAAPMNKNVFFRVVVPLLEVIGTALICISTPLKKANFYSELCDLKDHFGVIWSLLLFKLHCIVKSVLPHTIELKIEIMRTRLGSAKIS
jgi:hypothetical protein